MKNILFVVLVLIGWQSIAQKRKICGNKAIFQEIKDHPSFTEYHQNKLLKYKNYSISKADTVIKIPVVIHVIHRLPSENISLDQIKSQLEVLNKDFRKLNADTTNVAAGFSKADVKFEFALATIDPNGNATSGITRTATVVDNIGNTDQYYKLVPAWNNELYINIWVCDIGDVLLGFAFPPNTPGVTPDEDGIVIGSTYFGTTGTVTAPYNLGRTTTHEVGHYFDLLHVWGDDQNPNCAVDDQIADTPDQNLEIYDCPTSNVSCGTNDMLSNYLQYIDDACMGNFTVGQKNRMRMALYTSRDSLQFGGLLGLTSLKENLLERTEIYPNPFNSDITLSFSNELIENELEIFVYNISGKLVDFKTKNTNIGLVLSLNTTQKGFYFIRLQNGENTFIKKLIKN